MQEKSKMVDLDMSKPANSFVLFEKLPEELRRYVWTHALPGPRIIHVERHLVDEEEDKKGEAFQDHSKYPLATHFLSPSPGHSIISLLGLCKESRDVVKQHYSLIFPSSATWISFSIDLLYLDWGSRYLRTPYYPEHFTSAWPEDFLSDRYVRPEFNVDMAAQVKNLVVHEHALRSFRFGNPKEQRVIQDLLRIFPAVELLVFADQLHSRDEAGEELVWLTGELGEESEGEFPWAYDVSKPRLGDCSSHAVKRILYQPYRDMVEENSVRLWTSILWSDRTEYGMCFPFILERLREEWENRMNMGIDPESLRNLKIVRKSVTSAALKKELLEICGSEENIRQVASLDWAFVKGEHEYTGILDLSQQIAFLKLVLSRISFDEALDCPGCEVRGPLRGQILVLLERIDALVVEELMRELVLREAEELTQKVFTQEDLTLCWTGTGKKLE